MKQMKLRTLGHSAYFVGLGFLLASLAPTAAYAACAGASPNIVCNSGSGITLNSTGGALHTSPSLGSPFPSNNVVSGLTGTISSIRVRFNNMSYDFSNDLDIALVSPSGTVFVLWSDIGTQGPAYNNQTFTLSDSATSALPCNTSGCGLPATGTYRPTNNASLSNNPDVFTGAGFTTSAANSAAPVGSQTFASRFNGENPNGTWKLYTSMSAGPDTGSMSSWDLIIATQANNAATTTSLVSSANPSLIPVSGSTTATITASVTSNGNPVTLGFVTFLDNGTTTLVSNVPLNSSGQATLTYNLGGSSAPNLSEGTHTITANYSGATGFGASNGQLTQVVDRATQVSGNTFCNTGTIAIPTVTSAGGNPYPSKLFVTGLSGVTQSVVMDIKGYTNPQSEDMNLLLVSPTGQKFIPFAYISDTSPTSGANITLSDSATGTFANSGAIASGAYLPSYGPLAPNNTGFLTATFVSPAPAGPYGLPAPRSTATFATAFAGASPNGTWTLYTMNGGGGGPGGTKQITNGWCLTFGTSSDPGTTTTISVAPTPSAVSQSVTVTGTVTNTTTGAPANNTQGTLTFKEGNAILSGPSQVNSLGTASFVTSSLTQGAHFLDAYYSGVAGAFGLSNGQVPHYVDAPTTNPSAGRYCNTTSLTFPNNLQTPFGSPYPTRITPSGLAGTVNRVTLSLTGLSHQFPDDLDLMLTGPNGNSLVVLSDAGGSTPVSNIDLTLDSTAGSPLPDSAALSAGTFRPSDFETAPDPFVSPAPTVNVFSASNTTLGNAFSGLDPNGTWTLWTAVDNAGDQGGGSLSGGWCLNLTMNQPQLTISKTHIGNFTQGGTGNFTITVGSSGPGTTAGTITVVDTPQADLTITSMSGNGWNCTVGTRTCTTTAPIVSGGTLPPITVGVSVGANAASPQSNSVSVSGGGSLGANATDSVTIVSVPDLVISKTTSSTFVQGGTASYSLIVSNSGAGPTSGNYTISDSLPTGLTASSTPTGSGWDCSASTSSFVSCVRSTVINSGASAPAVTVAVNIASDSPLSITNTATVAGGGQLNTSNDTGSVTSTVSASIPDLRLIKSIVSTAPIYQGAVAPDQLVYRLTITNIGNGPTTGTITLTDPLPTGLTLRAITVSNGWSCGSSTTTTVICSTNNVLGTNGVNQINLTFDVNVNSPLTITNSATVSGGGDTSNGNNTSSVNSDVIARVPVTINVPAGVTFSWNGVSYTGPQSNILTPIGNRTVSVTSPQTAAGARATWVSWSDGGAASHNVTVAANTPVTITGTFSFEYQLTTAASPSNGGTVTPVTGFFDANAVVPVTATPNSGFVFSGWSGACAGTGACSVTMDAAKSVTANFTAQTGVTINVPAGISYSFNGQTVTGSQTFNVAPGSYVLSTTATQSLGAGAQAVFQNWSDGLAITHNVVVGSTAVTITGAFKTQYRLTTAASPSNGGTVTPVTGFFDANAVVPVTATPNSGFVFSGWSGACAGTGACSVTMDAAKSVTANFTAQTGVTINVPAGISYSFNGQTVTGSQTFNVAPGSYVLSTTATQSLGAGAQAVFQNWSDGLAITHNVVVGSTAITITGAFKTQYRLTTAATPSNGGTVTPVTGFFDANAVVPVTATPNSGFVFSGWSGACAGTGACSVTMDAAKSVTANFSAVQPAPNVTAQTSVSLSVVSFSRATGRYSQIATITNNGGALASSALAIDNLAAGYTVYQPAGVTGLTSPAGSPYLELGAIPAGGTVSITVQYTRVGTPALTYTPRVLGAGQR